jgi:electron transfer flavoprotein beta subunit
MSPMNIVVCAKQIPDPAEPGALDPQTKTLKREGKLILDESDMYGVEMALQLAEAAGGGEVTLVSMAPDNKVDGLRSGLAMGAAKAILVSDPALAGTDALGTAKVLAGAVGTVDAVDLVLTATESSDGYTGTVPEQLAALLGMPSVTFAKSIEVRDGKVFVQRQTDAGYDEVECPLPCVVSVTAGVVEPRYPSFKGIMAAKSKPLDQLGVSDVGVSADAVGWSGGGQEIVGIEEAPAREAGEVFEDDGTGVEKIIAYLENLKVI